MAKVNPSHQYSVCKIDMVNLFDEGGDPIFNIKLPSFSEEGAATTATKPKMVLKLIVSLKEHSAPPL